MGDYLDKGHKFVQCIQGQQFDQYFRDSLLTTHAAQIIVTSLDHYNAW